MVLIDTVQALLTAIWNYLTHDEELKTIVGGTVRLRLLRAKIDDEFPYLVHKLDSGPADPWVLRNGTYYLNLWDSSPTVARLLQMRDRVIKLLDQCCIGLANTSTSFLSCVQAPAGEPPSILVAARLALTTDGFVDERNKRQEDSAEDIWHYALQFELRYSRSVQEIEGILAKE